MSADGILHFGPLAVDFSHPDKVLFPDAGLTKQGLLDHYLAVADRLLPLLADRPLSLHRFPEGIAAGGFYQKKVPAGAPAWLDTASVTVKGRGERQRQVVCSNRATLAWLAGQGVIAAHPWPARRDRIGRPDRMVFDLDPPGDDFAPVRTAARGLARGICEHAAARRPDALTVATRKAARGGRLFLDYLRNAFGQTAVAPYTVRPLRGAPVATPLAWGELADRGLDAQRYRVDNLRRRFAAGEDPWAGWTRRGHAAGKAARLLARRRDG